MQTIFEPDALERKENQLQLFFTRIVLFAKYIFHIKKTSQESGDDYADYHYRLQSECFPEQ